ncbi:MAG: glycosyltransferase family 4 protein [Planctomycetota bacterium]
MTTSTSLKIAVTHTRFSYTGGVEKYIYSLVTRLLDHGHEVHYFAHRWEPFEHERLTFHRVPMLRFPKMLRVVSFDRACNRMLARGQFDLVHGFTKTTRQDIYTDGSGCLEDYLEATLWDRPRWYRRLYRLSPHQLAIAAMERGRFQRDAIRRIIPMARFVADQILSRYDVDPKRVEVVYNGVELDHFHPRHRATLGRAFRQTHGVDDDTPVLLFVGNDWRRKGLDVVLRALPEIRERLGHPVPLLFVAGHDNRPDSYRRLAERLGVATQVRWLGSVREIRDPFAAADLFLFPSRYDVFGNVGLEALASGVPSILSARAGVSEILDGSIGGERLDDPDSARELADRTVRLLAPRELAGRREAARRLAEPYSWDAHFRRILEIYGEVLAEKRSPSERRP